MSVILKILILLLGLGVHAFFNYSGIASKTLRRERKNGHLKQQYLISKFSQRVSRRIQQDEARRSSLLEMDEARSEASLREESAEPLLALQKSVKSFADSYNTWLETNPLLTKVVSAVVTCILGDVISQMIDRSRTGMDIFSLDVRRTLLFALCGGVYYAPIISIWLDMLECIPVPDSFTKRQKTLTKLFVDQTVGVFTLNLLFFFGFELVRRSSCILTYLC